MAITKKKPRKKRRPQATVPPTQEETGKVQFRDEFQSTVGQKIEEYGSRLEGKGRNILYGLAAVGVLMIIVTLFYMWNKRTDNAAQAALGSAIEKSQARITDVPLPAGVDIPTFKSEKERAEAAIKEFQAVIDTYGGSYGEKAKYFIAVNRLAIDRAAGAKELEALAATPGEVGSMSKFALAQVRANDGKYEDAEKLYRELNQSSDPIISKETIRFELARVLERQNKQKEAVDLYFQIAKEATEAKDPENNPVPLSQTAAEAKEKLEELDPERAKQIAEPELPTGLPLGM